MLHRYLVQVFLTGILKRAGILETQIYRSSNHMVTFAGKFVIFMTLGRQLNNLVEIRKKLKQGNWSLPLSWYGILRICAQLFFPFPHFFYLFICISKSVFYFPFFRSNLCDHLSTIGLHFQTYTASHCRSQLITSNRPMSKASLYLN